MKSILSAKRYVMNGWSENFYVIFSFNAFLISSIILVAVNRDKKAWYMLMLCITFLLMFSGIIIYFAKIGGLTSEQRRFFFLITGYSSIFHI